MTDDESLDELEKKYKETRKRIEEFEEKALRKQKRDKHSNEGDDENN